MLSSIVNYQSSGAPVCGEVVDVPLLSGLSAWLMGFLLAGGAFLSTRLRFFRRRRSTA